MILDLVLAAGVHWSLFSSLSVIFEDYSLLWNVLAAVLGGLFIALIIIVTKGKGMGGGDLKLVVLMGLLLGVQKLIIAMYIAVITGSIIGVIWGAIKGKIIGFKIPFALFLSTGFIAAFLWGEALWGRFWGSF